MMSKIFHFLLFFFFLVQFFRAQEPQLVDNLKHHLQFSEGKERVMNLCDLCYELKYQNAKEVEIHLYLTKGNLILSVEDNGKGFLENNTITNGHGMMNMQSRARALSAEINFENNNSGGLMTTLRVPIGE